MKSFKQFLNEADIKGNPAISPEYLNSLNQRAEQSAREIEAKYGRDMGSLMRAVGQVQMMQRGKEKQLETLTRDVIMEQYGAILGETELDIRIPTDQREMKQKMDQEKPEDQEIPSFKDIEDEDTKTAIHKRKILNMIAQGEAINSKKMLMSDTNVDGLTELFGEANAKKMVDLLVMITDICNARDWRIPEEVGARMIEMGNGKAQILKTSGSIKLIGQKNGPVLGIHIVGARVGELLAEAQLIFNWEASADDVAPLIHAHPTMSEAMGEAHMALAGKPLHAHG